MGKKYVFRNFRDAISNFCYDFKDIFKATFPGNEGKAELTHENDISNGEKWNSIQCRITPRTLYCIIGDIQRRRKERKKQSSWTSIKPPFVPLQTLLGSLTYSWLLFPLLAAAVRSFSRFFMLGCTFGSFLLFHYVSRLYCTDTAF